MFCSNEKKERNKKQRSVELNFSFHVIEIKMTEKKGCVCPSFKLMYSVYFFLQRYAAMRIVQCAIDNF